MKKGLISIITILSMATALNAHNRVLGVGAFGISYSGGNDSGIVKTANANELVINEIQVGNIDQFIDPSYDYGGWIELYNTTSAAIPLSGLYISDEPENLKKYRFLTTSGSVPANGFKTIWFDHNSLDGQYGTGASNQVRFKLNADGGSIIISDTNGNIVASLDFPKSISRCSYARTTDNGSTWRWTSTPTPGATNAGSTFADVQLPAPEIDINSGLISESMSIKVTSVDGATIRYTSDGSTPTLTNGFTATTGKISVSATRTFRFRAFKDGYLPSPVVTRSYIMRDKDYTLPIVSVVTDSKNLYDNIIGIYTDGTNGVTGRGINYKSNKNMDWERPVNFEYFAADGNCKFNQEATFYISGGWSRHWNPTSFKLKAEKRYEGLNSLDYPFFEEKPFNKHKCIIMRNGGNDTGCRTKDATIQRIIQTSGVYLDGQAFNPCHVFLNGKYLAMLNMREPSNKFFAYSNYGIDTDFVDAFELSPDAGGQVLKAGTIASWNTLLSLASKATNEDTYRQIVDEYLDIDEYTNYMAAQCWLGCSDWLTNNNNTKAFRAQDNGRFHFVMFDIDSAFDYNNMLTLLKGSTSNNVTNLFNRLAKNATFKQRFITAYCIMNGSVFTTERAQEAANYVGQLTESALALENKSPWGSCNGVVNSISNTSARTSRMNALKSYFSLSNPATLQLSTNISEAKLAINDQNVPTNKFSGQIYTPATLTTTAPAGYNFVGWKKGTSSGTIVIAKGTAWNYYDKGSLDGQDWKTGTINWSSGNAPLGYGNQAIKTTISFGGNSNDKYPTYYFRRSLNLDSAPGFDEKFTLNFDADDGFIIYINGVEAGRYLMPAGDVSYNTYATTYASGNPDTGSMELKASLFRKGDNIIAVELHNNAGNSSDIYWNAELLCTRNTGDIVTTDRSISLSANENVNLVAVFEPIPEECLIPAGSTPVVVNEISAGNTVFINDYYKKNDWIELYNTTSAPVDVAGMYLSDDPAKPHKYQISATEDFSTVIPAHGYLIIWADKLDPMFQLHASFKLGNNDGECVLLTAADDSWTDRLDYVAHNGDESVGRYPDGGRSIYKMTLPTIARSNMMTSYSQWISGVDENFDIEAYLADIEPTTISKNPTTIEYYTIDGIRLNAPQRGLNIIRQKDADGAVTTKKIIIN